MESVRFVHGCCGDREREQKASHLRCCGLTRHFITKTEQRQALEEYQSELQKELAGIEERLRELT